MKGKILKNLDKPSQQIFGFTKAFDAIENIFVFHKEMQTKSTKMLWKHILLNLSLAVGGFSSEAEVPG